ncbi:transaldolase [Occallatibacter riparius]|uniref:Transaldolase n=1 Tax=Occallatibacter riparius TaxID=1002689 RepID=A0A9J7BRM1_9BACT|nr:transaldolase [Occallatibacter riparius]UWZ85223.1 transaldolase [Occallatibacter riparius]
MRATALLRDLGQSLWLDNITRDLIDNGKLKYYIDELSITGVTSNPTIFDHAIKGSNAYDAAIVEEAKKCKTWEDVFFELAIADVQRAADLLSETHTTTNGVDGWVSIEVPPSLAYETEGTIAAAQLLSRRVNRPNVFIKIPGTPEGLAAVEEMIFSGIPINITLLFSPEQYSDAADAYLKGIERRIAADMPAAVPSVASLFVSRWDVAVQERVSEDLRGKLGVSVAARVYARYRGILADPRWQRAFNYGALPQRLLWASTGTKHPNASPTYYIDALAVPFSINTMPDVTLNALADKDRAPQLMNTDTTAAEMLLTRFAYLGIQVETLGRELQEAGATSFQTSWDELMDLLVSRHSELTRSR